MSHHRSPLVGPVKRILRTEEKSLPAPLTVGRSCILGARCNRLQNVRPMIKRFGNKKKVRIHVFTKSFRKTTSTKKTHLPPNGGNVEAPVASCSKMGRRQCSRGALEGAGAVLSSETNDSQMRLTTGLPPLPFSSVAAFAGLYIPSTGGTGVCSSTLERPSLIGHAHDCQ
jgi:hypothetical protein